MAVQQRFDVVIKAGSAESMFPGTMLRAVVLRGAGESLAACLAHVARLLYVDGATAQVRRVLILDAQGNKNRFDFSAPIVNTKLDPGEFTFSPPAGTQIVQP